MTTVRKSDVSNQENRKIEPPKQKITHFMSKTQEKLKKINDKVNNRILAIIETSVKKNYPKHDPSDPQWKVAEPSQETLELQRIIMENYKL